MAEGVRPIMLWPEVAEEGVWITVRVFFVLPWDIMAMLMSSGLESRGLVGVLDLLAFFFDNLEDFFFLGESAGWGRGGRCGRWYG